jgi:hypothetical protein
MGKMQDMVRQTTQTCEESSGEFNSVHIVSREESAPQLGKRTISKMRGRIKPGWTRQRKKQLLQG